MNNDRQRLLSRNDIEAEYGLSRRWLELSVLSDSGPPMIKLSGRMVRYQRGAFEDWLASKAVPRSKIHAVPVSLKEEVA